MTRTSVNNLVNHLGRRVLQRSLICNVLFSSALISGALLLSGCEGSQIGDNLGKSLESDPQLAGEAAATENNSDSTSNSSATNSSGTTSNPESEDETDNADDQETDSNTTEAPTEAAPPAVIAGDYRDIGKAPEEIQPFLVDLIELGLLEVRAPEAPAPTPTPAPTDSSDDSTDDSPAETTTAPPAAAPANLPAADEFRPNQAMTRREYARWLLATNNKFYAGERTRKIRPGVNSSQPVFQDVPITDKDFASIQGLAEAGIIPSPLTGSTTTITFRPNAPLTRKDLLLWKVPLDTRQALPEASISAVAQAWGFQDADKIEPRTLQAVLADYQNGDFANIRRAFNYTTLFQPDKAATRAEGAAVLWRFGKSAEGITAAEIRNPNSSEANNNTEENSTEENTSTDD